MQPVDRGRIGCQPVRDLDAQHIPVLDLDEEEVDLHTLAFADLVARTGVLEVLMFLHGTIP
jgi:hypothetical protein